MSDEEIICTWMEPRPKQPYRHYIKAGRWWWHWIDSEATERWMPARLDLNALWEVEERLTDEQWKVYEATLGLVWAASDVRKDPRVFMLHAKAEEKTYAMAAVLRPLVEG